MNASSAALVVLLNLHDKLVEKRLRTVDLFRKIDESGDGVVDPEEFRTGLNAFGFTTSDEDFQSLMEVLDKEYVLNSSGLLLFVVVCGCCCLWLLLFVAVVVCCLLLLLFAVCCCCCSLLSVAVCCCLLLSVAVCCCL